MVLGTIAGHWNDAYLDVCEQDLVHLFFENRIAVGGWWRLSATQLSRRIGSGSRADKGGLRVSFFERTIQGRVRVRRRSGTRSEDH